MNQAPNCILHVENVYKRYGDKVVLDNIDLSVAKGELCTVVGPSGCGKSTLLRLVLGQEFPTSGQISIDGAQAGFPDTQRGIVYQRYSLFPHLSVLDNVTLGPRLSAKGDAGTKQEAMKLLERVRLEAHAHKMPHELSGGMRQRVAIAQSLIMKPKILLMDEPFGALDPDTREEMQLFLLELWEEHNMTIFFVTHDLNEAAFLGTRLFALSQYYTDDRGEHYTQRGARLVVDIQLPRGTGTNVKHSMEFTQFVDKVRDDAFDPDIKQHVKEFNLKHPHAFQTLTPEESS